MFFLRSIRSAEMCHLFGMRTPLLKYTARPSQGRIFSSVLKYGTGGKEGGFCPNSKGSAEKCGLLVSLDYHEDRGAAL